MSDSDALFELYRSDLAIFTQRAFLELYPAKELIWGWHLDVIGDHLQAVGDGERLRQIIAVPPRSLKSFFASVAWPAFLLGHQPDLKIIAVSYAQPLADDLARLFHSLMTSDFYQRVFPTRPMSARQAVENFQTSARGFRMATSIGGPLTGRGADLIIIDDPMKAEDALSEAARATVKSWFRNTLPSRTDNKATGRVVLVMQRLHQDDPAGFLMEDGWPALTLPAIAPVDMTFTYNSTSLGLQTKRWLEGEALQPDREPLAELERLRLEMGSFSFAAQYQQDPAPVEGNIVKAKWLRHYDAAALPTFRSIVQSWDTASKTTELHDYSVCTTWGVTADSHFYLLDVFRQRLEHPALVREVARQKDRHKADLVLIEDKVSGTGIIQDLSARGFWGARAIVPKGDKAMRFVAASPLFEQGRVLLPKWAPWLDDYVRELITFPGKHDDQVDSTTQALRWLVEEGAEPGIIGYYRQLNEHLERPRANLVRVKPPQPVGHVTLRDGNTATIEPDGTFVVPEDDGNSLLSAGWEKCQ